MRTLRLRMGSRALALITLLGVLLLTIGLATLLALSAKAADRKALTPQEELTLAVPMLQKKLSTNSIQGVMMPGTEWVAFGWEPTNGSKRRWTRERGSLAWPTLPAGACDSESECEDEMDDACSDSGNGGCDSETVELNIDENGGTICSCDCTFNGAVAFQICGPVT